MAGAAMGWAGQFGTKAEVTYATLAGAIDQRFVFDSEGVKKQESIVEREGLRGTRSHASEDTRKGPYTVGGPIVMRPTPEDLAIWLPRGLGAAPSSTTYALADTLPSFSMSIDRETKVFSYVGCMVNRMTFTGSSGGMLTMALDIIAAQEGAIASTTFTEGTPGDAASFPALTPSITQPYMFHDLVLTLLDVARKVEDFELVIDNALVPRMMNSRFITECKPGDRIVTLRTNHDYSVANADLYAQALAGDNGTLVFTNGNYSTTFAFAKLQAPDDSPTIAGKGPVPLVLNMQARTLSTTKELVVTHDSTP